MKLEVINMYFHQETSVQPVLHPTVIGTKAPTTRNEMAATSEASSSTTPTQEAISPADNQGTRLTHGNAVQPGE